MKKVILIFIGVMLSSIATYLFLPPQVPHSPLGSTTHLEVQSTNKQNYLVLGFAPYWNMKKIFALKF